VSGGVAHDGMDLMCRSTIVDVENMCVGSKEETDDDTSKKNEICRFFMSLDLPFSLFVSSS